MLSFPNDEREEFMPVAQARLIEKGCTTQQGAAVYPNAADRGLKAATGTAP